MHTRTSVVQVITVLFFMLFAQNCFAQSAGLNKAIKVSYHSVPLSDILRDITEKTGVEFSYSPQTIDASQKISYAATKSTRELLNDIFKQAGIEYEMVGNYLVLQKAAVPIPPPIVEKPTPLKHTLSGYVYDAKTNEILIGAAIYNKKTGTGTLSNMFGYYSLNLAEDTFNVAVSFLGYTVQEFELALTKNIIHDIKLETSVSVMQEVTISSEDKEELTFVSLAAQTNIKPLFAQQQTAALGETDMLKSLDNLPGISFQGEGSSYFFVRGGNRDQNLVLLDDAPLYNPSHLLGLFSPVIPEAVKNTDIYKADFPIQYGGRLSSVIDIRTKDGNMQQFSGNVGIGLISNRISLEGPFKKNSSSYIISYRHSHLGMYLREANPNLRDFYFNDFTAKFNIKLGKKDRLFLTVYDGTDKFLVERNSVTEGLEWSNKSLTLRWNHVYGSKLFSNTTIYTSAFDYYLFTDRENQIFWNSQISGNALKTEFTWFSNPEIETKFGIQFGGYFFNPGNYNRPDLPDYRLVSRVNSGEVILYAGNEQRVTEKIKLNYGLRLVSWSDFGEAFSVDFNQNYLPVDTIMYEKGERYYRNVSLEPRLSVSFRTSSASSVKLSYNKTIQHINLINNSISPFNSLDVWLPSSPNIKPQYAHIFDLGFMKTWTEKTIDLSADIYFKNMLNQPGFIEHPKTFLNPFIEGTLRQGKGKSYGFEVYVKKSVGKYYGQAGYGFSRSYLQIEGINENRKYKSRQDKPVDLSLGLGIQLKPRWHLNTTLFYNSGMRITTPTGFYNYNGAQVPFYSELNNQRLPNYSRFDVSTTIRLNKKEGRFSHYLNISIYNFFGNKNASLLYFNKTIDESGVPIVPADNLNPAELVPTYRYIYSFVPSFNYNLKF